MIRKRMESFGYAMQGLRTIFRTQANFRIHVVAAGAALALSAFLRISRGEWLAVVLCIGFVLLAEAFNTALEFCCDAITQEHHPLIGKAKDVGAAAVLIAALCAVLVAGVLFVPRLVHL